MVFVFIWTILWSQASSIVMMFRLQSRIVDKNPVVTAEIHHTTFLPFVSNRAPTSGGHLFRNHMLVQNSFYLCTGGSISNLTHYQSSITINSEIVAATRLQKVQLHLLINRSDRRKRFTIIFNNPLFSILPFMK